LTQDISNAVSVPEGYHALRHAAGVLDRSRLKARLRLTGADRRAYLQGLLTNDIAALASGSGCYAAYLTAQGRMIADMRLFEVGDALLVDLEPDVVETVRTRWEQFIFTEDVQVGTMTASHAQVGVYGPGAARVVEAAFSNGRTPAEPAPAAATLSEMPVFANGRWDFRGAPAYVLRSDDPGVAGFDIVLPVENSGSLLRLLNEAGAPAVPPEAAEVCRIEAGRPRFHQDMDEDTIPLEAGIEDRAISQTKGCYVGQEIIIRVLHRGHGRVARKLTGLSLDDAAAPPLRGAKIVSADREVGAVTSAVRSIALGRPIALGYLHRDFLQPGTPVSIAGAPAIVEALPFVQP
jgi:folate-binding protein YgfZ